MNHRPVSSPPFPQRGLYAITAADGRSPQALLDAVKAALRGGTAVLQYRCKSPQRRREEAPALREACRQAGVPFIVNDDLDLAEELAADGVHLGSEDGSPAAARNRLRTGAIIGVSCYDSTERALQARREGADYVAFGRFFPSPTKPQAPTARLETLAAARALLDIPIVAIGGVSVDNGGELLRAGADLLAVIDGVFGAGDPETAARRIVGLFDPA